MNIVYATDDNGALGTGVSIVSLMENLPLGVHADIYIMTDGLSGDNTARFHSLQQDTLLIAYIQNILILPGKAVNIVFRPG